MCIIYTYIWKGFPGGSDGKKCLPAIPETRVQSLGWEDPLEKETATHPSTLAWKIPWIEEPGRLQSTGVTKSQTRLSVYRSVCIIYILYTHIHIFTFSSILIFMCIIIYTHIYPLQCSCLENPRDGGAWWAAVYGVTQGQTWLKRLSSSIYIYILKTSSWQYCQFQSKTIYFNLILFLIWE